MKTHETHSQEETQELAAEFAKQLHGGEVVELIGGLGAGKTTFVRGAAKALGSDVRVKSPTFTILNEYPVDYGNIKRVVHLDLYRFEDPSQLEALAFGDYDRPDTVIFVEWPDIFGTSALNPTHVVKFEHINETTRQITL